MIHVTALSKSYSAGEGNVAAVRGISFTVEEGQFYTLLGPSGCGKSTTLRCVAGLEVPTGGQILLGPEVVFSAADRRNVPVEHRPIGVVFQNYAVWPHMTVFDNVAYPLRVGRERPSKHELRRRVLETLDLVGLADVAQRPAPRLSGGQQQRVALARAIVRRPRVLLLDEPLSNLDARLRDQMRGELRRLQETLGLTTLFVTHDQTEALSLSNVVSVMKDGEIAQTGAPRDIYERPASLFVARFVGSINVIEAEGAVQDSSGPAGVSTRVGQLAIAQATKVPQVDVVVIRPENVILHDDEPSQRPNVFRAVIGDAVYQGDGIDVAISLGDIVLRTRQHPWRQFRPGSPVWAELPPDGCIGLPRQPPEST